MATADEAAQHLCMSRQAFLALVKKGVIERQPRGSYDLDAVRRAYIEHLRAVAAGQRNDDGLDLVAERARLAKEQADAQAMKNAIQRGELIPRPDVVAAWTAVFAHVRARLLALPSKAAPAVVGLSALPEVKEVLSDHVEEALAELAETRAVPEDPVGAAGG